MKLENFDNVTKLMVTILVGIAAYLLVFLILNSVLVPQPRTMQDMMRNMTGNNIHSQIITAISIGISIIAMLLFYSKSQKSWAKAKPKQKDELSIIKRALSEDEKKVIDEIEKTGKITQDSLRFRLGWSKAKLSAILTRLDRMRLIQRERMGKTYNLFLEKKRK